MEKPANLQIIEPVTETGYRFRCLATAPTPSGLRIGNLHFTPGEIDPGKTAGDIFDVVENASDEIRINTLIKSIWSLFSMPEEASAGRAARTESFLPVHFREFSGFFLPSSIMEAPGTTDRTSS